MFVVGTPWASGYYRMTQAQVRLQRMGYTAESVMFNGVDPVDLVAYRDVFFPERGIRTYQLREFDVIIFQMIWHAGLVQAVDRLNDAGKKTVMEIDDDYFSLPPSNPSWLSFHPKLAATRDQWGKVHTEQSTRKINPIMDNMINAIRRVKQLQVSTPELAEVYGKLNPNVVVIENCIDNELYDAIPTEQHKEAVLGWYGTRTHIEDLRVALSSIPTDTCMYIGGYFDEIKKLFARFPKVTGIEGFPMDSLPAIVKKADLGIVPLVQCKFNDGKSDLKGLEYGAAGIPVIASDTAAYRRWIRHGWNGFLVKDNKSKLWQRYIELLLKDKPLRDAMGAQAKKDATKRDIKNHLYKYIKAYF